MERGGKVQLSTIIIEVKVLRYRQLKYILSYFDNISDIMYDVCVLSIKNLLIRIININKYSIMSYKCTNFAP